MSNGQLIRDINKATRITKKANNKAKSVAGRRLKNSTSDEEIYQRASAANPFIWEKKRDIWLTEEGQLYLQSWANDGLNNDEIAKKMGVDISTLYRWMNAEGGATIKNAIMRGRDTMTMNVENMLYKCAQGYYYEEETVTKDGDIVKVQRYAQPSAEAQKFILTNRRRDKWKSKQEVALEAQVQAEAKVENKIVTAEDVAKSILDNDDPDEFEMPGETEEVMTDET